MLFRRQDGQTHVPALPPAGFRFPIEMTSTPQMDAHSILPLDHTVQDPAQGLNLMDVPHEFFQQESAPQDVERRTRVVLVRLLDTKAPSHPAGQSE